MKVNIVMSTYNGERFLSQQIDSILAQTYQEWNLLIRDDGSSDRTPEIIAEYAAKDKRITFINADKRDNYGVIKNFYTLVKHDQADYYFFSDQDDVWLPEKLQTCLDEAQAYPSNSPLLVYTDLKVVNQDLEVINDSMIRSQSHHANTSLLQELTENTVTGGTMMINHALAELWTTTANLIMHDWYLALLASALGKLVYIDSPLELYRQHDSNVLGARTLSKRLKTWFKPHKLISKYWWLIDASQKQAENLLQLELPEDKEFLVKSYVDLMTVPLAKRLQLLNDPGFRKNRNFHTLVFRTLVISKLGYRTYQKKGYRP